MRNDSTRRGVLKSGIGLATAGVLGPVAMDSASGKNGQVAELSEPIPRTPEEIREAFADVPYNQDPTDFERSVAQARFPGLVVPDQGPVPDPMDHMTYELAPPRWALATAYDKGRVIREQGVEPNRRAIDDRLVGIYNPWPEYVLPDGSDAIDAILAAVEEDAP